MKYSEVIVKEICDWIAKGASNKEASSLSGIGEETFYGWLRKTDADGKPNPEYKAEFSESIKKAYDRRKVTLVNRIIVAAARSWQAAAWYLERTDPEHYGPKGRLEITNPEDNIKKVMDLINKSTEKKDGQIQSNKPNLLPEQGGETIPTDKGTE